MHGGGREFGMRITGTRILAGILIASWAFFASYYWLWLPFKHQWMMLKVAGLVYQGGPILLVGDSILAGLPASACALSLVVPGMQSATLDADHASAVASRQPSRVIVMIGINDLRSGAAPSDVARSIGRFVSAVQEREANAVIVVLSILPVIENEMTGKATNALIRQANEAIRAVTLRLHAQYVDITGLFGGEALTPSSTYDGLHLNAHGSSILANALFQGLARKANTPLCSPR